MQPPFLVCKFSKETLSNLVRERFGDHFPDIVKKPQVEYIFNYLNGLSAESILMESEYIDGDYLEDYSRYYVKCFNRYGERCARLHFFSIDIDHTKIENGIENEYQSLQEQLQESYLGFIVIKPLPKTFIGKSCLKIDPNVLGSSAKVILKKTHKVNLFGINLTIDALPFQEQDKVVSACATTAIWSLLHAQKDTLRYSIPSSSEITLSAINHIDGSANSFPNKGLSNKQILRAIDTQGYRNHKFDFDGVESDKQDVDSNNFLEIVKPYMDSNIPMLLGCDVYAQSEGETNVYSKKGGHAVTVIGYKDNESGKAIYIHDDRFGPYARAVIHTDIPNGAKLVDLGTEVSKKLILSLHHRGESGEWEQPSEMLVPDTLIIPTHPKVRLPITKIKNTCHLIDEEVRHYYRQTYGSDKEPKSTYSIKLISLDDFRQRVISSKNVKDRLDILCKNSPRFLWLSSFRDEDGDLIFDIAFDATDIPQGEAIAHLIIHDEQSFNVIKRAVEAMPTPQSSIDNFFPNFVRALEPKLSEYEAHLNESYGSPRAPLKLKPEETANDQLHPQKLGQKVTYFGRTVPTIAQAFPELGINDNLIWAISLEGTLLVGQDIDGKGHPTLTGYKPARIAGELHRVQDGWFINSKSGRYSRDYPKRAEYLKNVLNKFLEVFYEEKTLEIRDFPEQKN